MQEKQGTLDKRDIGYLDNHLSSVEDSQTKATYTEANRKPETKPSDCSYDNIKDVLNNKLE